MDKPDTEFRAWRRRLNIASQADAARLIGRSRRQIAAYEAGADIPRVVRLAMLTVEFVLGQSKTEVASAMVEAMRDERFPSQPSQIHRTWARSV